MKDILRGFIIIISSIFLASCAGSASSGNDDISEQVSYSGGPRLSIYTNTNGRSVAAVSRSVESPSAAIGSSNMYLIEVTLEGSSGYSVSKTAMIQIGSNSATVSFDSVPIGSVTANAVIISRYHKKWTGLRTVDITEGNNSIDVPLTEDGFDFSELQTGDIILESGGYVTRSNYVLSDSSAGTRYAALKIGSQIYAVQQGLNQYSGCRYSDAASAAASQTGISWAAETSWRLPTQDEFQALYDQKDSWMGIYSPDGAAFGLTETFWYWTDTDGPMATTKMIMGWSSGNWTDQSTSTSPGLPIGDEYICKIQ